MITSKRTYAETLAAIRHGGVCVYPTGTFYAVGCRCDVPDALERVARIKNRPGTKPFTLLAGDVDQIAQIAQREGPCDDLLKRVSAAFWPGPLTVVLPARPDVHPLLLGPGLAPQHGDDRPTVAVRCTAHPLAAQLARDADTPLVATSANRSGQPPAALPGDVERTIVTSSDGILALRPWPHGGVPSTIVAPAPDGALRCIRIGAIPESTLSAAGFSLTGTIPPHPDS